MSPPASLDSHLPNAAPHVFLSYKEERSKEMNLLATLCTVQCARVVGSSVKRIHQARRDCACLCVKTQTFTAIYRADKATNHFIASSVLLSPSMLHILDEIDFIFIFYVCKIERA